MVIPIDTVDANIEIITNRLQNALEDYNARDNLTYRLSISVGLAYYDPEHPCSIDELLVEADKKMYEQKRQKQWSSV